MSSEVKLLDGKVALVTGATQGIGRAIVERLARDGAAVIVVGRSREKAEAVAQTLRENGATALAIEADVSRAPDVTRLFDEVLAKFGRVDVLVNNAGINGVGDSPMMLLADATEDAYEAIFGVNVRGTLLCLREAALRMSDNGRIINVSSSTTLFPMQGAAIYAASKAAMKTFTEVGALELGGRGITVNSVLPGVTETPMNETIPADMKQQMAESSPFKRIGTPQDTADVVAFLASDDARWITGQHILVNGGAKN